MLSFPRIHNLKQPIIKTNPNPTHPKNDPPYRQKHWVHRFLQVDV